MSGSQRSNAIRSVDDALEPTALDGQAGTAAEIQQAVADKAAPVAPKKPRRSPVLPVIALALLAGAAWYGYGWWTDGRFMVSTDDAYIEGDIAIISPKVAGYVAKVDIADNQFVKAGDPLVTLDDGDYRIAADQARAQIAVQHLTLRAHRRPTSQGTPKHRSIRQMPRSSPLRTGFKAAEQAHNRVSELQAQKFASNANLDTAESTLDQARASLIGSDANIAAAKASIAVLKAQRAEAEAGIRSSELALEKAERDLGFTVLRAPYDGIVGNLAVQTGDLVSAGKRLAALVPVKELYIDANFKETQIADLVPGSKVNIHVDAFEDEPLVGTVTSIAPASGSVFSMLPAENATGNFTKVVQRVPVRIALPREVLESGKLRAGLSVVVDVDTRTAPAGNALAAR